MTRINGQSSLVALIALKLERRRASTGRATARANLASDVSPLEITRRIAVGTAVDERQAKKSLVRALLVEQFGDSLASDAAFERVALSVFDILEHSETGKTALTAAMSQLIASN